MHLAITPSGIVVQSYGAISEEAVTLHEAPRRLLKPIIVSTAAIATVVALKILFHIFQNRNGL